jgi:hypothetical protein
VPTLLPIGRPTALVVLLGACSMVVGSPEPGRRRTRRIEEPEEAQSGESMNTMKGHNKKRCRTLRSCFSPALTLVISSGTSLVQQLESEVGWTSGILEQELGETSNASVNDETEIEGMIGSNDPNVVLNDPRLRMPIEKMNPNLRDVAIRAYILKGPCQPKGHKYLVRKIYGHNMSFHDKWFNNHPLLECSVVKDDVFVSIVISLKNQELKIAVLMISRLMVPWMEGWV